MQEEDLDQQKESEGERKMQVEEDLDQQQHWWTLHVRFEIKEIKSNDKKKKRATKVPEDQLGEVNLHCFMSSSDDDDEKDIITVGLKHLRSGHWIGRTACPPWPKEVNLTKARFQITWKLKTDPKLRSTAQEVVALDRFVSERKQLFVIVNWSAKEKDGGQEKSQDEGPIAKIFQWPLKLFSSSSSEEPPQEGGRLKIVHYGNHHPLHQLRLYLEDFLSFGGVDDHTKAHDERAEAALETLLHLLLRDGHVTKAQLANELIQFFKKKEEASTTKIKNDKCHVNQRALCCRLAAATVTFLMQSDDVETAELILELAGCFLGEASAKVPHRSIYINPPPNLLL